MNRIFLSQSRLTNNLAISVGKTLRTNPSQIIRGRSLLDLNLEIKTQIWSASSKLIMAKNILPLIHKIDFRNNSIESSPPGISLSNSVQNFDINLKIIGAENHTITSFWLIDTFITSVISSVDIYSLMVGNLFNIPGVNLYPSDVRDHFNRINSRKEISKLYAKYNPATSNPTNYLSAGRKIWGHIKHGGLQNIIEISHTAPDMGQPWEGYIKHEFNQNLSQADRKIDVFCTNLLEEGIIFISSINQHLGNRLNRELLPLTLTP